MERIRAIGLPGGWFTGTWYIMLCGARGRIRCRISDDGILRLWFSDDEAVGGEFGLTGVQLTRTSETCIRLIYNAAINVSEIPIGR